MKRKAIAVCVTGYDWEYESKVINSMKERCFELDINLLVFASTIRKPGFDAKDPLPESVLRGEIEIFNLINYDMVDGVAILGDNIVDESVIFKVSEECDKRGIPIVNINDADHRLKINVDLSDKTAMEKVVRHVVEQHGARKVNFIGGFKGNQQTEERLAAYKKVLSENGIPIEESRIAYGNFWDKARDCTIEFMKAPEKPDAIICASDTMAIFCMDYLNEIDVKVPDDIIVTGFDGIRDCENCRPTLTSIRRNFSEAGTTAVDLLYRAWQGEDVPAVTSVESELLKRQSCGCKEIVKEKRGGYYSSHYSATDLYKSFNTYIIEMNMSFARASTSVELFESLGGGAYTFKLKRLYLCICAEFERESKGSESTLSSALLGSEKRMISMVKYGHDVPVGKEFSASSLLPENLLELEKPIMLSFTPLYFKNNFLGYLAYEPSVIQGQGDLFATWVTAICNNAGSFYMKNELQDVADKLKGLYVRDPLTGLYNRRGLEEFGEKLKQEAEKNGAPITVICADVDRLKPINDVFGHEAGDNAILQTAFAIRENMPESAVCSRTGGDEFSIILTGFSQSDIKRFVEGVNTTLDRYNQLGEVPYTLGCSCGFYTARLSEIPYEDIEKLADEEMYKVKTIRKTHRK